MMQSIRKWLAWWWLVCGLFQGAAVHAETVIDFATLSTRLDLVSQVSLLEDSSGQLMPAQALQLHTWLRATPQQLNRGVTNSVIWLRLAVVNRSDKTLTRWLALGSARLEHVRFFRMVADQTEPVETAIGGLAHALQQRPEDGLVSIFPVRLLPGERSTLLLRVSGRTRLSMEPVLWEPLAYRANESSLIIRQLLPLSALLGVALYMFVHGIAYRTADMVLLAAWLTCLALFEFSFEGHLYRFILNGGGELGVRSTVLLSSLCMVLSAGFTPVYLRLQRRSIWHWSYCAFIIAGIFLTIQAAFGDLRLANALTLPFMAIFFLFWPISIGVAWLQGARHAGWFLLASFPLWTRIMLRLAEQQGWLPMNFIPEGLFTINPSVVLALAMVFSSVREAFFDQRAYRAAQAALLKSRQDEHLRLESLVRERTQTLQDAVMAADEANRSRSELLARVNQDLRRPADEIVTLASSFKLAGGEQAEYGAAICGSAKDLQSLIDDLIEEAGTENSLGTMKPEPVDIRRLLDGLAVEAEGLALANGNAFAWQPSGKLPTQVLVDPKRLRQVLINLLDNAAKFTQGGHVRFEAKAICCAETTEFTFTVNDTGIGMSAKQIMQLFEPYQRAESSRGLPGLGLGLAIARHWLDRMGGSIKVDSIPGRGTTMQVTLPMQIAGPSSAKPVPQAESRHEALRPDATTLEEAQHYLLLGAISELLDWSRALERSHPQCHVYAQNVQIAAQRQDLAELRSLIIA